MIKTWEERCVEHPDHQTGMVSYAMIQARMQEEIDELRAAVFDPDWDRVKALEESLREHMAEIQRLKALRAALAQPEQEPVAYQWLGTSVIRKRIPKTAEADAWQPLYTAPPQRKLSSQEAMTRKPLTESEVNEMYREMFCVPKGKTLTHQNWFQAGVAWAENAHGIGVE